MKISQSPTHSLLANQHLCRQIRHEIVITEAQHHAGEEPTYYCFRHKQFRCKLIRFILHARLRRKAYFQELLIHPLYTPAGCLLRIIVSAPVESFYQFEVLLITLGDSQQWPKVQKIMSQFMRDRETTPRQMIVCFNKNTAIGSVRVKK